MKEAAIINGGHSIFYGRRKIDYSLFTGNRKTMEIAVHPDSSVIVKAPKNSDILLIENKLKKRARWILKQISYFRQFDPRTPARCYVNGESHLYLGKRYRLKLKKDLNDSVKLSRGFFHVHCTETKDPQTVKRLLDRWYLEKAKVQFKESMDRCWQKLNTTNLSKPSFSIKRMKRRWGSLSKKGTMTLNTELIKAPKECIDYVVTHELCHLKYNAHSREFYRLLDSVLPEWEKIKHKLELGMV